MAKAAEKKVIELWDGYEVDVDLSLLDDFDFSADLSDAVKNQDIGLITELHMALVGGDKTYEDMREYLTEKDGRVTVDGVSAILEKINSLFPKAGNRAQRRSWKSSR